MPDLLIYQMDDLVGMVQGGHELLLVQHPVLLRHVEYKMFCANLNVKHLLRTFQVWLNQLAHLNWRHLHKLDHQLHELDRKSQRLPLQIRHV